MRRLFTSESVTEGHPDKICDQISDAILDEALRQDKNSRVACETFVTTGLCSIMGEITTNGYIDFQGIAREVIKDIGYTKSEYGFDYKSCGIISAIDNQSVDIAMGTNDEVGGAGDQGIIFGYACNETPEYMPLPISLASKLAQKLTEKRKNGSLPMLRPDGKTQVTVEYDDNNNPIRVDTVVISTQHDEDVDLDKLEDIVWNEIVMEVIPKQYIDSDTKFYFNPTGRFVIGGPHGDTGLTGRKIIVDTYGGYAHHGGGAFSGKDPTKVDRSACYMARCAAKNVVASGLADKCEIQLAYAIGIAKPVSILVDTFNTNKVSEELIVKAIENTFDFTPAGIISTLDLRRPIYRKTSNYGHFGREDADFYWERTDKVSQLKDFVNA